jgi:hypothetical protein
MTDAKQKVILTDTIRYRKLVLRALMIIIRMLAKAHYDGSALMIGEIDSFGEDVSNELARMWTQ